MSKNTGLGCMVMILMTCVLLSSQPLLAQKWEKITTIGDTLGARYGHSMTQVGDDIYVFGGGDTLGMELNDLWTYNTDNGVWEKKEPNNEPPSPRKDHCAFAHNGKLYIGYGDQGGMPVGSGLFCFNPDSNSWKTIYPSGDYRPEECTNATATVIGDSAFIFGGRNPGLAQIFFKVWLLNLRNFQFEEMSPPMGGSRYGHSSVAADRDLFFMGGKDANGYKTEHVVYHPDLHTSSVVNWDPKPNQPSLDEVMLRMFCMMFYRQLYIYVFGGQGPKIDPFGNHPKINLPYTAEDDTILCDMWKCNTQDSSITRCPDLPVALTKAACAVLDDAIYVFGGMKSDGTLSDALYRYQLEDTQVETGDQAPDEFCLYPNYPNPFNPSTTIRYAISKSGNVRLRIFNLQGKQVQLLVDDYHSPGTYSVSFQGKDFSSGVYFYQLETEKQTQIHKMLLIK